MKSRLLVLPLLLALAGCAGATKARVVETPNAVAIAPQPEPQPVQASMDAGPFPLDGAFVYSPDPRCTADGVGRVIPDLPLAICMRAKAVEYVTQEAKAGRIPRGPKFKDCSYPSDPEWPNCVEFAILRHVPEIRFGQTSVYGTGSVGGKPYTGCAFGQSWPTYIRVSLADVPRTPRVVAWETANVLVVYLFDRPTLGDGPIAAAATAAASAACGVN